MTTGTLTSSIEGFTVTSSMATTFKKEMGV